MGKLGTAVRRISCLAVFPMHPGLYAARLRYICGYTIESRCLHSLDNLNRRNHRQFQAYISVRPREAKAKSNSSSVTWPWSTVSLCLSSDLHSYYYFDHFGLTLESMIPSFSRLFYVSVTYLHFVIFMPVGCYCLKNGKEIKTIKLDNHEDLLVD